MQDVADFVKARIEYQKKPDDISLNLSLALAYMVRNRLKDAQPMIQRVLKADPDNALGYALQIYHQRALARIGQGEFDEAKKDTEKVSSWDKEGKYLPEIYFQMAFEFGNRNQMDEAVSYFEKVYTEYPDSASADGSRFYAGLVYSLQQKDDKALPLLRDYVEHGQNKAWREYAEEQVKKIEERMQ